jgi:hypothetical protein
MDINQFCTKVVTIPQYSGTCWLNAILMSFLYSQYSRKLLLNDNSFKTKRDKLSIALNEILLHNYIRHNKIIEYFNLIKPETILSYIIPNKHDVENMAMKGWIFYHFIPYFLDYINKSYMILENYNNTIYTGILDLDTGFYEKVLGVKTSMKCKSFKYVEHPDYICMNIWTEVDETYYGTLIGTHGHLHKYQLNSYTTNYKGLHELRDEIYFNGQLYRLDSCILNNYNSKTIKNTHSITGITCKNNRYVYNGWLRITKDPALDANGNIKPVTFTKEEYEILEAKSQACELMPFNWNIHNTSTLCLNSDACKIDIYKKAQKKTLCFSFNKGRRTVIYVKVNDSDVSIDKNITDKRFNIKMEIKQNNKLIKKTSK